MSSGGCWHARLQPYQPMLSALRSFPTLFQDKVRQSLEQQQQKKKQDMAMPPGARPSALDRFVRRAREGGLQVDP